MNPYDPSWPAPDAKYLDSKGDFFLGRRLPEYGFTFEFEGQEHPMRFVGRRCYCEVHGNEVTRDMRLSGDPLPCELVSELYYWQFAKGSPQEPGNPLGQLHLKFAEDSAEHQGLFSTFEGITTAVMATMADQIRKSSDQYMRLRTIVDGYELGVKSRKYWFSHPEKYLDAHSHGCSYATWIALVESGIPQLARPGFIDEKGCPTSLLRAIYDALPSDALSTVIPMWDQALDAVDIYGAPLRMLATMPPDDSYESPANKFLRNYFERLPITTDHDLLRAYVRIVTIQHTQRNGNKGIESDPNWEKDFEVYREYLAIGLSRDTARAYAAAKITPAEAVEGMCRGIVSPKDLLRVQNLARKSPGMPFSKAAWLDALRIRGVSGAHLNELPPLSDISDRSDPPDLTHNREANLYAVVVPSDWWQSPETRIESLESDPQGPEISL